MVLTDHSITEHKRERSKMGRSGNILTGAMAKPPETAAAQWLRRCATNRKVACSIPDGVTGIFH